MPSPEWALFGCMVRERNLHSESMRRRVHGARAKSALGKHAFRPLLLRQPEKSLLRVSLESVHAGVDQLRILQHGADVGDDLVHEIGPLQLAEVVNMDDVFCLGQAGQVLHELERSAGADGHPDDAGLGHERVGGLLAALRAHGLAVGYDQHDGGRILAAVDKLGRGLRQGHGGEGRRLRPLEVRGELGDLHGVIREVLHPRNAAVLLHVRSLGVGARAGALVVVIPCGGAAEEL
mmetsp:Transcript_28148/g.90663  ORF Transcript_28148/g.90663 Transcript_28148/m.90663 type:complete len:235 (+) Transcript_28148:2-706(+)